MANSETKIQNFVGLLRQYYSVPDAQKSTALSPNPLGSISINLSLFSKKAQSALSALGASVVTTVCEVLARRATVFRLSRPLFEGTRRLDEINR